jgi:hypothetical protein
MLANTGLAKTGLAKTGLANTGLANTGLAYPLAYPGLASTGRPGRFRARRAPSAPDAATKTATRLVSWHGEHRTPRP